MGGLARRLILTATLDTHHVGQSLLSIEPATSWLSGSALALSRNMSTIHHTCILGMAMLYPQ